MGSKPLGCLGTWHPAGPPCATVALAGSEAQVHLRVGLDSSCGDPARRASERAAGRRTVRRVCRSSGLGRSAAAGAACALRVRALSAQVGTQEDVQHGARGRGSLDHFLLEPDCHLTISVTPQKLTPPVRLNAKHMAFAFTASGKTLSAHSRSAFNFQIRTSGDAAKFASLQVHTCQPDPPPGVALAGGPEVPLRRQGTPALRLAHLIVAACLSLRKCFEGV